MADPEKLSQQPLAQSPGAEGDFFYSVQSGQTRRMTRAILRTGIMSAWQTFIRNFLGAADAAAARTAIGAISAGDNITGSAAKLTTARNIALTGDGTGTASFDGTADASIAVTVNRKVAADYIAGLQLQWVGAAALTVGTGSAYIASTGQLLNVPAAIAKTGLTLAANSKFHVYLFSNAGAPDIEIVATAPSAKVFGNARTKTGDTTRRYLGSIFTAAANTIIRFKHSGNRMNMIPATPATPLSNGVATASIAVSFTASVPETATHAQIDFTATHTNGAVVYLNDADMGAVSTTNFLLASGANQKFSIDLPISSAQAANYLHDITPTPNGLYIRVLGYLFER